MVALPSIHDSVKTEEGGPVARKGFAYQDAYGVRVCLLMMDDASFIKAVWCEQYDDIVLIKNENGQDVVEFCQVKDIQHDQFWSRALLCSRSEGVGTSLLETSLARDIFFEPCTFRVITSCNIKDELKSLSLPLGHPDRAIATAAFQDLSAYCNGKIDSTHLLPGGCVTHWLARATWETPTRDYLDSSNLILVQKVLESLGFSPTSQTCEEVYQKLLWAVKSAGELQWKDRDGRKFNRSRLESLLRKFVDPYPDVQSSQKLQKKLEAADLDSTYIQSAFDLRNTFRRHFRESTLLDQLNRDRLQSTILSRLGRLRRELDSGELNDTPLEFYNRCIAEVESIRNLPDFSQLTLPEGFFEGCMYDISGRCGHRYTKAGI